MPVLEAEGGAEGGYSAYSEYVGEAGYGEQDGYSQQRAVIDEQKEEVTGQELGDGKETTCFKQV